MNKIYSSILFFFCSHVMYAADNLPGDSAKTLITAGLEKKKVRDYRRAIDCFSKAIEIDSASSSAFLNRAYCKNELMDYPSAIDDFTKALLVSQTWDEAFEAYYNRGLTEILLQDFRNAINDMNYAIKIYPEYSDAYYNRSIIKGKLGDFAGELKDISKAIELKPTSRAYNSRGIVNSVMGRSWDAINDFTQ